MRKKPRTAHCARFVVPALTESRSIAHVLVFFLLVGVVLFADRYVLSKEGRMTVNLVVGFGGVLLLGLVAFLIALREIRREEVLIAEAFK